MYRYSNGVGNPNVEHFSKIGNATSGSGGSADTINIGNTLIVSKTGDDSRAQSEDLNNHYLTVASAVADAENGDVIVVYAGNFNHFGNLIINKQITFLLNAGAIISNTLNIQSEVIIRGGKITSDSGNAITIAAAGELRIYDAIIESSNGFGLELQNGKAYVYNCAINSSNDGVSSLTNSSNYLFMRSSSVKGLQALDLRGDFDVEGCTLEGKTIEPLDIYNDSDTTYQSIKNCQLIGDSSGVSVRFQKIGVGGAYCLLSNIVASGTIPYDSKLIQHNNIEVSL